VPRGKPAPDVYLDALQKLDVPPDKCLAFEDSVNGARAARAANLRVCAIPGHDFSTEDFCDITPYIYASLDDVRIKFGTYPASE
jgi:beta-phosphoglucomutase-like phosphatase (HAD superfamily)